MFMITICSLHHILNNTLHDMFCFLHFHDFRSLPLLLPSDGAYWNNYFGHLFPGILFRCAYRINHFWYILSITVSRAFISVSCGNF